MNSVTSVEGDVAQEIAACVLAKTAQLQAMTREQLKLEFQKTTGMEAHPRITTEWLVTALARICQDEKWCEKTGAIPKKVALGNTRFWLSNTVYLVKKDVAAEERKRTRHKNRARETGNVQSLLSFVGSKDMALRLVPGVANPWRIDVVREAVFFNLYTFLKRKKLVTYDMLDKWCRQQPFDPLPRDCYTEAHSKGVAEVVVLNENGEPTEISGKVPVELVDEVGEAVRGDVCRDTLPGGQASRGAPKKITAANSKLPHVNTDAWVEANPKPAPVKPGKARQSPRGRRKV